MISLFSLLFLSLSVSHSPAEIQHCLVSAGDVGCGVFECFENNSCEIRGLQEICMTFLHNAGKFDSQVRHTVCVQIMLIHLHCVCGFYEHLHSVAQSVSLSHGVNIPFLWVTRGRASQLALCPACSSFIRVQKAQASVSQGQGRA